MTRPSMYEFAGGAPAMRALAAAHYQRCLADPVLSHPFSHHTGTDHVERLAAYWAEVLGGPAGYSGAGASHSAMLAMHAGEGMPAEMGERFAACFVQALDDAGLPDDPDFRAGMRSYIRWAVTDVMAYASLGAQAPAGLPMPRWTWDGLEPAGAG